MKKHKSLMILGGVLLLLIVAYFGVTQYVQSQEKKQTAKEEAEKIYATDVSNIVKLSYTDGSQTFAFTEKDDTWTYDGDSTFPLDDSYVTSMVSTLSKIEALRKLEDPEEMSSYGLDQPSYTMKLTDGTGNETTIYIGSQTGDDYYLTTDQKTVYTVDSTAVDALVFDLNTMVKLDTFPTISSGNLVSMEITKDGTTTTYTKDNEEEIATVAGGLGTIAIDNMITYNATDDSTLAQYGLDSASRITAKATYTEDDEEKVVTIYIGKQDDTGENDYIQLAGSGIVYGESVEIVNNLLNQ